MFACGVTLCRLARRAGRGEDDAESRVLAERLKALSEERAVRDALKERPVLLREAAAELGIQAPWLLGNALARLGLETLSLNTVALELPPEVESFLKLNLEPAIRRSPSEQQAVAAALDEFMRRADVKDSRTLLTTIATLFRESVDRHLK